MILINIKKVKFNFSDLEAFKSMTVCVASSRLG